MNVKHLLLSSLATYLASNVGGNAGSISTIHQQWHAQSIYHRCIMPNVGKVCGPPQYVATLLGVAAYVGAERMLNGAWAIPTIAACLVAIPIAFAGARRRGLRIYADAVRRAGIVDDAQI